MYVCLQIKLVTNLKVRSLKKFKSFRNCFPMKYMTKVEIQVGLTATGLRVRNKIAIATDDAEG